MLAGIPRVRMVLALLGALVCGPAWSASPLPPRHLPFRIQVVDEETGRGVPLVELRTVNQIRYFTDSNGIVAFDEPGLMGRKVFFTIKSHGYEYPKDGFGIRGAALEVSEGGSARLKLKRLNIARRLYRMTGAGIYRDSVLTGVSVPIREPVLNGQVLGQDSVLNAVFGGKIHWFWGDTNRPGYPLGNFHTPGAVSLLPSQGGLDPEAGVDLTYYVDEQGFARPTCKMPGDGPTWVTGLTVLHDRDGRERIFAFYAKIRNLLETYEWGLVEFNQQTATFEKRATFPLGKAEYPGERPSGHPFLHEDQGVKYVYFPGPYPLVRVPADPERLGDLNAYEAFTCLRTGTAPDKHELERDATGQLHYSWKKRTPLLTQAEQNKLVKEGRIKADEGLLQLRDPTTGKTVLAHGGSVYWNAYRKRWVMIVVESFGTSFLGEVWYAEADSPLGPWAYARKVVTHDDYSFYNPKHHPMFDKENGRVIFFEGTYTSTFSGNKDPTPRYDYNQVMYQLELSDQRLALPVAIHAVDDGPSSVRLLPRPLVPRDHPPREVAFFAPDRDAPTTVPVYELRDPKRGTSLSVGIPRTGATSSDKKSIPLFYVLPAETENPPPTTVPLYEYRAEGEVGNCYYSVEEKAARPGYQRNPKLIGRVWKNPSRVVTW